MLGIGAQQPVLEAELERFTGGEPNANPYVLRFLRYLLDPSLVRAPAGTRPAHAPDNCKSTLHTSLCLNAARQIALRHPRV